MWKLHNIFFLDLEETINKKQWKEAIQNIKSEQKKLETKYLEDLKNLKTEYRKHIAMGTLQEEQLKFHKEYQKSDLSIFNRTQKRSQIYNSRSTMTCFTERKSFLSHLTSFVNNYHPLESIDKRGDIIDHEDVVRKQYSSLPYPEVAQATLDKEYDHYNVYMKKYPYHTVPTLKLENLNQFLYDGKFQFR